MTRALLLVPLVLAGCDDHLFRPEGQELTPDGCGVEEVYAASCATSGCHGAATAASGLDLETDMLLATLDVDSPTYPGNVFIVPGDPDASFLLQKLEGTHPAGTGSTMPLGSALSDDAIATVREWIADGADECAP
ncbi:MAG: hypothetical protein ACI8PZ_004934 [Myxococcota bacterium]|jgi:hypothetical protein